MFSANTSQGHTILYDLTLDALEEEDYCHFETALEFLHNRIHFFIGGSGTYSMSTLDYSAFDPFFMLVHSSMDRIWVLWEVSLFVNINFREQIYGTLLCFYKKKYNGAFYIFFFYMYLA